MDNSFMGVTRDMRIAIQEDFARDTLEMFFMVDNGNGKRAYIQDIIFKEYDQNEAISEIPKGIHIPISAAKHLMNELWLKGYRPSDDIASTGQLEAMKDHVKTLQSQVVNLQAMNNRLLSIVEDGE